MSPERAVPLSSQDAMAVKADVLSHGLTISQSVLEAYGYPFLEKRRAYNNPDPPSFRTRTIPQEMYLESAMLVASVNVTYASPWTLDHHAGAYWLWSTDGTAVPVTFPKRPAFYDWQLSSGQRLTQVATLYGGRSLGIFVFGSCALVDMGKACQYCSIAPNRQWEVEFEHVVRPEQVKEAVALALRDEAAPLQQVMLNGGNFPDLDKSFLYYARLAAAAEEAIKESGRQVDLHLIVFPPRVLELFRELIPVNVAIAMNTEVFDAELFARYCPGKAEVAGREHILKALERAAELLGPNRVYSIFVGGLEPLETLERGLRYVAERNVAPVINVLHTDPGTPLERHPRPSTERILEMGRRLQDIYAAKGFRPFYEDCGRNSLDTEAYRGFF